MQSGSITQLPCLRLHQGQLAWPLLNISFKSSDELTACSTLRSRLLLPPLSLGSFVQRYAAEGCRSFVSEAVAEVIGSGRGNVEKWSKAGRWNPSFRSLLAFPNVPAVNDAYARREEMAIVPCHASCEKSNYRFVTWIKFSFFFLFFLFCGNVFISF